MANNKVDLGCKQLRGSFLVVGKVTGRLSQNFYKEGNGKNGKAWRRVHFGVEIEPQHIVYVDLSGSVQDNVYFSKRDADTGKTDTKNVNWADRTKNAKALFGDEGYRLIGVTCGCTKVIDKTGRERNDSKILTAYDACDEVGNLNDGDSVLVRGNITYSTYKDQHRVSFEPTQISLCGKPVDFDDKDFKPRASFEQSIVCMGVDKNEDTPGEAVVAAKIVNYSTIEDTEFYTRNAGIAKNLKRLGEYVHIKVWGDIVVEGETQKVAEDNGWGSANPMERLASPFKRKLMITGADPESIDEEAYSEEVIDHAIQVINGIKGAKDDYGAKDDNEDWGTATRKSNFSDDEDADDFDLGI